MRTSAKILAGLTFAAGLVATSAAMGSDIYIRGSGQTQYQYPYSSSRTYMRYRSGDSYYYSRGQARSRTYYYAPYGTRGSGSVDTHIRGRHGGYGADVDAGAQWNYRLGR